MKTIFANRMLVVCGAAMIATAVSFAAPPEGEGWEPLFNGEDLGGWTVPSGNEGIWTVQDGVIDCMPRADAPKEGDNSLWSEEEFGDIQLYVEWRIKETKGEYPVPVVLPDGSHKTDENGEEIIQNLPNADSGIYLRGTSKAQVNIWCWPVGSGEVYGYRMDKEMPAAVRAGVTPSKNMDKPVGEWNTFLITMDGDKLTVELNGEKVLDNAQLPGVPEKGALALQHHGGYNASKDEWNSASSLVQFRNVYVKKLD
ncbi:MAG: DUF1080 domain-containing protein [Candidatus Hydrogenedentes bacterium]|nr:DUF1080 domain-containing protein [Candidatus Hydrogenedentota bacterium]